MFVRSLLFCLLCTALSYAQQKPVVVLELFTSQGCSSCPPADAVLEDIKNTSNPNEVITLSYHVDYWDYIGWKDPYASKKFTNKQRVYGRKFYSSSIYTPQLVINGQEHLVGSDRDNIHRKIKKRLQHKKTPNALSIKNVQQQNGNIDFSFEISGAIKNKNIHYILAFNEKTTDVKRGENSNRTLKNNNIVIKEEIEPIATKNGTYSLKIPENITKNETLKLVVLISDSDLDINTGAQYNL